MDASLLEEDDRIMAAPVILSSDCFRAVEPSLVDTAGRDNWWNTRTRVNYAVQKYNIGNLHLRSDELQ